MGPLPEDMVSTSGLIAKKTKNNKTGPGDFKVVKVHVFREIN